MVSRPSENGVTLGVHVDPRVDVRGTEAGCSGAVKMMNGVAGGGTVASTGGGGGGADIVAGGPAFIGAEAE